MGRRVWIIAKKDKVEQSDIDDARTNNCPEIANGIPPALADKGIFPEMLPIAYEEPEPPAPPEPEPPRSGYPAQLVSVNPEVPRPARVKRVWGGKEYFYDCLATEAVVEQYQAGNIAVGDYLWVEFLDESEDIGGGEQIVIGKVRKTW